MDSILPQVYEHWQSKKYNLDSNSDPSYTWFKTDTYQMVLCAHTKCLRRKTNLEPQTKSWVCVWKRDRQREREREREKERGLCSRCVSARQTRGRGQAVRPHLESEQAGDQLGTRTQTTKGRRGELHGRHNTAIVPLFYTRFISPPSLQIFGGTLWITYWYWEYCTLYIVKRNYSSLSAWLFKDACFVVFGFCLLLYLNCALWLRGYLIVPGFEIVGRRSAPTGSIIFLASCDWL